MVLILLLSCNGDVEPDSALAEGIPLRFVDLRAQLAPELLPATRRTPAWIDIDDDGDLDLVEATAHGPVWHRRDGDAYSVAGLLDGRGAVSVLASADLDGRGGVDLVLSGADGIRVLLHDGDMAFGAHEVESLPVSAITLADLDGDGDIDAVAVDAEAVRILDNPGDGQLVAVDRGLPEALAGAGGVVTLDADDDGALDVFVAGSSVPDRLYLNDGEGFFLLGPVDALPTDSAPGGRTPLALDLDQDGDQDLFVPSTGQDRVLVNDGSGRFVDETPFRLGEEAATARDAAAVDLDLDGAIDVVVISSDASPALLKNDGTGRFYDYSGTFHAASATSAGRGVAVGDIDDDGDPDLFIGRGDGRFPWVLVNWSPDTFTDADGDGVPDPLDECVDDPDPLQTDRDGLPFHCDGEDDCLDRTGCSLLSPLTRRMFLSCPGPLTWTAARDACLALDADLAIVGSEGEQEFLVDQGAVSAWIGLSDTAVEGTFVWVDGSAVEYSAWAEGEPNDSGDAEDCGYVGSGGAWNDLTCSAERAFVCEVAAPTPPTDPPDACDNCPDVQNPDQADEDDDGVGDACSP